MTAKEAIETISKRIKNLEKSLPFASEYIEALKMSVKSLEKHIKHEYRKPKDIDDIREFIYEKLKKEYGSNVISTHPGEQIVVDTETSYRGNSDVWITMEYFH